MNSAGGAAAYSENRRFLQVDSPNEEMLRNKAPRGDDLQPEQGKGKGRLEVSVQGTHEVSCTGSLLSNLVGIVSFGDTVDPGAMLCLFHYIVHEISIGSDQLLALEVDLTWTQGGGKVQHIEIDVSPYKVRLSFSYNFALVFPHFKVRAMHRTKVLHIEAVCWPQIVNDQPA